VLFDLGSAGRMVMAEIFHRCWTMKVEGDWAVAKSQWPSSSRVKEMVWPSLLEMQMLQEEFGRS
jgi:hypothetical protein